MKVAELQFVFDTNTIISAFIFPVSKPGLALKKGIKKGKILISSDTYQELANVLLRDKFDKYINIDTRIEVLAGFLNIAQLVNTNSIVSICRDSKDNKFLRLQIHTC